MTTFAARLLAWFDDHARDLPWRRTRDPWAIWISEVMLQQTRVETVRRAYQGFVDRFPHPADLARASDDQLLGAWRGLGYYRRARLLRDAARVVVREHRGLVPADPDALATLPGIGEYTRGAVASIAFGRALPAVDGNVERVLARHRGIGAPVKSGPGRRSVRDAVLSDLPADRPGDFNQALMELGATVCTPRSPRCADCPVAGDCVARGRGIVDRLPVLPVRRAPVEVQARVALAERSGGTVVGYRIPGGEINGGQLDLPGPGPLVDCSGAEELGARLFERFAAVFRVGAEICAVRHGITHHRITLTAHRATLRGRLPRDLVAAGPDDPATPWTTTARKIFARLARAEGDR